MDSPSPDHLPSPSAGLGGGPRPRSAFDLAAGELIELFEQGDVEIEGRMPYSSNVTLLVVVADRPDREPGRSHRAVYKPGRGERPLWDFPPGLYRREVAMYRLASALGWQVVPPTTIASGPLGEGSIQAFVDADFSEHYFTLLESGTALGDLQRLCALDLIANSADRKSGHCLLGRDGRAYGIDNGLSFHAEFKLRTVIWDFADEPVPADILESVARFLDDGPPVELLSLLGTREADAMLTRARALLAAGCFPDDDTGGRRYPWPLV